LLTVHHDANGNIIGSYTDITQTILNSSILTANPSTGQDVQRFVNVRASGTRVPNAGSLTLAPVNNGGGMGGGGGGGGGMMSTFGDGMIVGGQGGTVAWNTGDDIQITWIGLLCEQCGDGAGLAGGGGGGGMGGGGLYDTTWSYQAFDNFVDAADPIATASILQTDPFTWDPIFGAQPALPPPI
jgi:hypothetical protein